MKALRVHRIQCYDYHPSAFTCLARSPADGLIAAGRADGAVEVYDERRNFVMIARFPSVLLTSVESLGWSRGRRLFCTGALGRIYELELCTSSVKRFALLTGSSVSRCLFVADPYILVGNDEGFITLFSIDDSSFSHLQIFPQLSGKVLSVAVAPCDTGRSSNKTALLVAASTDRGSLTIFFYEEKRPVTVRHVLLTESLSAVVWSLLFVRNVLFSGDNCGNVCVWDPNAGALMQTFPSHVGLVLALTAAEDSLAVFSGGSDATVRKYVCTSLDTAEPRWQLSGIIRGCRRDIRGLAYLPGLFYDPETEKNNSDCRFEPHRLLAVGLDSRLQVLSCTQSESCQIGPAKAHKTLATQVGRPRNKSTNMVVAHVAALPFWPWSIASGCSQPVQYAVDVSQPSRRWCLLHYPSRLVVLRLSELPYFRKPYSDELFRNPLINPVRGPLQLGEIRPKHGTEVICCAMVAFSDLLIAYSDLSRTCVLKLSYAMKYNSKDETKTKVRIERIRWKRGAAKHPRMGFISSFLPGSGPVSEHYASSDTASDTDTNDDDDYPDDLTPAMVARYFALDDEFQTASTRKPGLDRKRRRGLCGSHSSSGTASSTEASSPSGFSKSCREWSTLPAASFLKFTPDAAGLILIDRTTNELISVQLDTGLERWRFRLTQDETTPVVVHALAVSAHPMAEFEYLIAMGCSDGRIYVHSSRDGKILFTCPRLSSVSGHYPYPTRLAFSSVPKASPKLAAVYTNNQLTEWLLSRDTDYKSMTEGQSDEVPVDSEIVDRSSLHGALNPWLVQFWSAMGDEFNATFGVVHSLTYLNTKTWLLASDRYVIQLKEGTYDKGDIHKRVTKGEKSNRSSCFSFTSAFESILQADALNRHELALVSIHSASIAQQLTSPLQQKLFGL